MKTLEFISYLAREGSESENVKFKLQQSFGGSNTVNVSFLTKGDYDTPIYTQKEKGLLLNIGHTGWFLISSSNNQITGYEVSVSISKEGLAYDAKKRNIELEDLQEI